MAPGGIALVIVGAVQFTTKVTVCIAGVPHALAAAKVTVDVPPAVGVPLITPVLALNDSPAGNPPTTMVGDGTPLACTVNE